MALINDPHALTHCMLTRGERSIGDDYSDPPAPRFSDFLRLKNTNQGLLIPCN